MKVLSDNKDLYEYWLFLSLIFKQRGAEELDKIVERAIGNAASLSTEFLGESRIALTHIKNEENGLLTEEERRDLLDILKQLDEAFKKG